MSVDEDQDATRKQLRFELFPVSDENLLPETFPPPSSGTSTPSYEAELTVIDLDETTYPGSPDEKTDTVYSWKTHFIRDLVVYVREFSETIEIHGIRYLFEEGRSVFERLFWFLIILGSLGACFYLIASVYRMYFDAPLIVKFHTEEVPIFEVPFPAVTICSEAKKASNEFNFGRICKKYMKNGNFSSEEEFKHYQYFLLVCDHHVDQVYDDSLADTLTSDFYETLTKFSPKVADIMNHCSYLHESSGTCASYFKPVYTSIGLCYTFNMVEWKEILNDNAVYNKGFFDPGVPGTNWIPENGTMTTDDLTTYPRRGFLSGVSNALRVHLKQNMASVDPVCTKGLSGFRVLIHDPLQLPMFSDHYFHVSLNTSVMVSIKPALMTLAESVETMPLEGRACYQRDEKRLKFFRHYSQGNCLTECLANFTLKSCGCVPFYMPRENVTQMCGAAKLKCTFQAKHQFQILTNQCDCKPFCTKLTYKTTLSVSEWNWNEEVGRGYLTIFFKNRNFIKMQRTEVFVLAELMAHIGALLNFFMGSSILTFVEIVYAFTLKILCNKVIYGPWAGPAAVQYKFD